MYKTKYKLQTKSYTSLYFFHPKTSTEYKHASVTIKGDGKLSKRRTATRHTYTLRCLLRAMRPKALLGKSIKHTRARVSGLAETGMRTWL